MTPRERVRTALSHKEPDRIPVDLGGPQSTIEIAAYKKLADLLDIRSKEEVFLRAHSVPDEEVLDLFQADTRYIYYKEPEKWDTDKYADHSYIDEWGKKWKLSTGDLYYEMVGSPLKDYAADISEIEKHKWPVDTSEKDITRWKDRAKYLHDKTDYSIIGDATGWGIFEESWGVRGLENFLVDLMINKGFAGALLDKVLETQIKRLDPYLEAIGPYADVICVSDDVTGQTGPIISPGLYREMVKPRQKELISFIKSRADVSVFYHCCGNVIPFLEDFIDMGVDIINPVQVSAEKMDDTGRLKESYGDRLVFWGGSCDSQDILPNGPKERIIEEVKRRIGDLAPGGGFVFSPIHNIQPDVPAENIITLFNSAIKYGLY